MRVGTLSLLSLLLSLVTAATGCWTYPEDVFPDARPMPGDTAPAADLKADGEEPADGTGEARGNGFHPEGWAAPAQHGRTAMLGTMNCATCHGGLLDGGSAGVGCDSCHPAGWRTNCTFCHGGVANDTGAPPEGLDPSVPAEDLAFPVHTTHVTAGNHVAWGCNQCHVTPTDVMSAGHLFDSTPGQAEVDMSGGLSATGTWDGEGSCSSLYCHGNGQGDNGTYALSDGATSCSTCHPTGGLSGRHGKHLSEGVSCQECHGNVLSGNQSFGNPDLHVNGQKDYQMPAGITYNGNTCSGSCHGEGHSNESW